MPGAALVAVMVAEGATATNIASAAHVQRLRLWWTGAGAEHSKLLDDVAVASLLQRMYAALIRCYRVRKLRICNSIKQLWAINAKQSAPVLEQALTCGSVRMGSAFAMSGRV